MNTHIRLIILFICAYPNLCDAHNRISSYPFIAGDTFRAIADHIIDETNQPFNPDRMKPYDIIFLKVDFVPRFFEELHPKITTPYLLITHNGDVSPIYLKALDHPWLGYDMSKYLEDPKLVAWFAQNIDYMHPKLKPIPIGIGNSYNFHGDINVFLSATEDIPAFDTRLQKVYLNFTIQTNVHERQTAMNFFKDKSYASIAGFKPTAEYLNEMKQYKYIVNPPGNGLDCHRTWEALLLGCVPIMKHSFLDPMFEDLPVIFVNEWSEVTEAFLAQQSLEIAHKKYNLNKVYAAYWIDLIKNFQPKSKIY